MSAFPMNTYRPTLAYIHLNHLEHNYRQLRLAVGENTFFCPMVKANAYGHGDVEIAMKLQELGVSVMGVGLLEEGVLLRQMGIQCEILVFGSFPEEGVKEILRHQFTPVLTLWEQVELLEKKAPYPIKVHLKFDTGMHRLGFDWKEADQLFQHFNQIKSKLRVAGICTHLHSAEDASESSGKSYEQLRRFQEVEKAFAKMTPISHTLNSAGMLNFIQMQREGRAGLPGISINQGVRPGLALYGYSPLKFDLIGLDLKPVMSLRSQVIRFHQLQLGEGVSYGHTWRAGRESVVGVVPIGYADGVHRILSNRGVVLFSGRRVPIIGNVCMDYLMIDVTDVVGKQNIEQFHQAEVTFFGYDNNGNFLPASEVASVAQTITWEVLTSIGERVPRIIVESAQDSQTKKNKEVRV
jgi:alanine racemase